MPGSKYCYTCRDKKEAESNARMEAITEIRAKQEQKRQKKAERKARNAPKWRRRRRILYALILLGSLAYAVVDFKTGEPRNWTKSTARTVGHCLKDLGDK